MIVISRSRITDFVKEHKRGREAESALNSWFHEANNASWKSPHQLINEYPGARNIGKGNGVATFKIKGNQFRLVTRIDYDEGVVKIEFIGTHEEYDKINVGEVTWKTL